MTHSFFVPYPLYIVSMEYNHIALSEKGTPVSETRILSHIEIRSFCGNHRLYLKGTGDCLATFLNHKEALRTASVADRALRLARRNWRKDILEQDTLTGKSS